MEFFDILMRDGIFSKQDLSMSLGYNVLMRKVEITSVAILGRKQRFWIPCRVHHGQDTNLKGPTFLDFHL